MKKYNLTQLLDGTIEITDGDDKKNLKVDGVQIPIIQRDYVQGRESESVIRDRFLDVIFDALINGKEIELDFIYGSIKKSLKNNQVFLPLDGQQRLTTLFLLHWYIGNKELINQDLKDLQVLLSRFSYATRATASSFCEQLAFTTFNNNPAEHIFESTWFHKRFELDPTVMSMTNMLHHIHKRYEKQQVKMYDNLVKIKFYILPLDGFDLTDELYIKMNARGKQLTDFENLKADINDWMVSDLNPLKNELNLNVKYHTHEIPNYLRILSKFDNEWTNTIWKLSKEEVKEENKVVDKYFMRFISRFILTYFVDENKLSEIENSELFKHFYSSEDNLIRYDEFAYYQQIFQSNKRIFTLERIFDSISENYEVILETIQPSWTSVGKWSFFDEKITQQQRILFFAICKYLELNTFNIDNFKKWIRVVWNIAIDPDIRSIGVMLNIMKLVSELSQGSEDIYAFFETEKYQEIIDKTKNFAALQLKEERIKGYLMLLQDWKPLIIEAESHPLFLGNIRFLIDDKPSFSIFKKRLNNAKMLFDKNGSNPDLGINHGLMRYIISKFNNWNQIFEFDYTDSYDNWQLILRRTRYCRDLIKDLCSLDSLIEMNEEIDKHISVKSEFSIKIENNHLNLALAHGNLYLDATFFHWIQENGLRKLRWLNEHIYIVKPNAWYNKVMIDCHRNELINEIDKCFGLNITERCGVSNYFKGEVIRTYKNINNKRFLFTFNIRKTFKIEDCLDDAEPIEIVKYNYMQIRSQSDLTSAIETIITEIKKNNYLELLTITN